MMSHVDLDTQIFWAPPTATRVNGGHNTESSWSPRPLFDGATTSMTATQATADTDNGPASLALQERRCYDAVSISSDDASVSHRRDEDDADDAFFDVTEDGSSSDSSLPTVAAIAAVLTRKRVGSAKVSGV